MSESEFDWSVDGLYKVVGNEVTYGYNQLVKGKDVVIDGAINLGKVVKDIIYPDNSNNDQPDSNDTPSTFLKQYVRTIVPEETPGNILYSKYGDDSIVSDEKGNLSVPFLGKDYYTTAAGTKGDWLLRKYGYNGKVVYNNDGVPHFRDSDGDWYISSLPIIPVISGGEYYQNVVQEVNNKHSESNDEQKKILVGEIIWKNNYLDLKARIENCTTPEEREQMILENGPALDKYEASGLKVAKDINDIRYKQGMGSVVLSQSEANKQMLLVIKEENPGLTEEQLSEEFTRRKQVWADSQNVELVNVAPHEATWGDPPPLTDEQKNQSYTHVIGPFGGLFVADSNGNIIPEEQERSYQQMKYVKQFFENNFPLVQNFSSGLYDAGESTVTGIYNMGRHPIDTAKSLGNAVLHPIDTGSAVWKGVSTAFEEEVIKGDDNQRAHYAGNAIGNVVVGILGTKGLDKAVDIVKGAAEAAEDVAAMARKWQGSGAYPGVDDWTTVTIKKGTKIWGGASGQSNFYTTDEVMQLVGNDATKLNQGLQVGKGTYPQFRPGMTQYEVTQDINVGYSKALANPQYGAGGFNQYFINGYENVLNPIKSLIMTNR